jgi:hypothetical protein
MDPKSNRLITTTLLGVVFGIICMLLSKYTADVAYWPMGVSFLLHHTVMGLVIGVSLLKMNWAYHGAFWGGLFGLFLAISRIGTTPEPWAVFVAVVIWGFLIETLATKAFKRPQL